MDAADRSHTALIPIIVLDEVDSTNWEAMRRAGAGERGPLWLVGRRQTHGRGRSGRAWVMQEGNLAASLLFEPGCEPAVLYQLSLVAGVAVHDALVGYVTGPGALEFRLKWPNDLMCGAAKLGGILVESSVFDSRLVAIVGIGVNVVAAPAVQARATGALAEHCLNIPTPQALVRGICERMQHWLLHWDHGAGFETIRRAWLERAGPTGQDIKINAVDGMVRGRFAGLDETGALLIELGAGNIERFTAGDVTFAADEGYKDDDGGEEK